MRSLRPCAHLCLGSVQNQDWSICLFINVLIDYFPFSALSARRTTYVTCIHIVALIRQEERGGFSAWKEIRSVGQGGFDGLAGGYAGSRHGFRTAQGICSKCKAEGGSQDTPCCAQSARFRRPGATPSTMFMKVHKARRHIYQVQGVVANQDCKNHKFAGPKPYANRCPTDTQLISRHAKSNQLPWSC